MNENFRMINKLSGQNIELSTGPANYWALAFVYPILNIVIGIMLIPGISNYIFIAATSILTMIMLICSIIWFIMSLVKKEAMIMLSNMLIVFLFNIVLNIGQVIIIPKNGVVTLGIVIMWMIIYIAYGLFILYVAVKTRNELYYWKYNQLITKGYEVENMDETIQNFIQKAQTIKKPWWAFWV